MKKIIASHKNKSKTYERSAELRKAGWIIERIIRNKLRESRKSSGVKFRYQHAIDPYIVDFCCLEARLIVEIDGMSHDFTYQNDQRRETFLKQQGFTILRFTNGEVVQHALAVVEAMMERARALRDRRWKQNAELKEE